MLNKAPTEYKLDALLTQVTNLPAAMNGTITSKEIDGNWVPARPEGYFSIKQRIKLAWMVFIGKADIVIWPGGQ